MRQISARRPASVRRPVIGRGLGGTAGADAAFLFHLIGPPLAAVVYSWPYLRSSGGARPAVMLQKPVDFGHRPGPSPVDLDDDQSGVVCGRDHRCGPAVLAAAALSGPIPGRCRAEDAALPNPAHRCPVGPRPTQEKDQNPGDLALGPRAGSRVPGRLRAPRPDLTRAPTTPPHPTRGTPPASGTGATRRDRRKPQPRPPAEQRSETEAKITTVNRIAASPTR
jgi:hypothetical protein